MAATDIRKSVIGIINEARQKFGLNEVNSLTSDKEATLMLTILNDVIDEVSDYGDWKEMYRETVVTASSSVFDYSVESSALVKNIHELSFDDDISPMWLTTLDDILRLDRIRSYGRPRQWEIVSVDDNANPVVRLFPIPSSVENNKLIKVKYYKKPRLYTTADVSTVPKFPSRMLVAGLVAKKSLEESGGVPTQQFVAYNTLYEKSLRDTFNRFQGNTGSDSYFRPSYGKYRRK